MVASNVFRIKLWLPLSCSANLQDARGFNDVTLCLKVYLVMPAFRSSITEEFTGANSPLQCKGAAQVWTALIPFGTT